MMAAQFLITQYEKEAFFEEGFFIRKKVFNIKLIEEVSKSFSQLQEVAKKFNQTTIFKDSQFVVEQKKIHRIVWAGGYAPELLKFSHCNEILVPVSQLLDSLAFDQIICQAHFKLPGDDVSFPWHQDSQFRGYGTSRWTDVNQKGSFVQTLVAIDNTLKDSGPLEFIPKSLLKGHLGLDSTDNIKKFVDPAIAVPVYLEPGDMVFFHPFAIHGSSANQSQFPRRVFINGFSYPGANHFKYPGCGLGLRLDASAALPFMDGLSTRLQKTS